MADGTPEVAEPEVMDVNDQLVRFVEEEIPDDPEEAEEQHAEEEPEETQETEESEEPEAEAEPEEAPKTRKVKVDGEEVEVTEDELERGYSRQQDYTRKTMKLAEERKALEAEAQAVRVERSQYAERLEAMKTFLDQQMGAEPDWEALKASDPAEYAVKFADYQRQMTARNRVEAEQRKVHDQQMQDQQVQLQATIQAERERLFEALPDWKQPEVAKKEQEALITYGTNIGFTEDELANLYDHRAVLILNKARLYDEAQARGKTVLKEKPAKAPVLKPGSPAPPKKGSEKVDKLRSKFKKTGRPQDAVALLDLILPEDI